MSTGNPVTPKYPIGSKERSEIIGQFKDQDRGAPESYEKFFGLTPEWPKDKETLGTRTSSEQREIDEPQKKDWPFVDYKDYSKESLRDSKSYPYYRNLVQRFGQKLPNRLKDKLDTLKIPVNKTAQDALRERDPTASLSPDEPATGYNYTGNYIEILTFLIPDEYLDPQSSLYNPDFHYANMHDEVFTQTEIRAKPGFNSDADTVPRGIRVPNKPKGMNHDQYMDKLYDKGILVYPDEFQGMKGHKRGKRLRQVVQNLFKLTVKMDNFSELSELSRFQQSTIEEYALQTRKMFYILSFLKDQMKVIDKQESELTDLISAMSAKTQQFERLLGKKQFNKFRQKTMRLREDKKAIENLTKYTTESILRRFKKLGISVDGVTDLDGPLPKESDEMIRWNTFKQLFDDKMQGESELKRLQSEYMQSIQGRGERLHLLLKFKLPGSRTISNLPQNQREALKIFLENAFDSLTSAPIDEGYEMLTKHDYETIGLQKGGGNDFLTFNVNSRNSKLIKDVFKESLGLQDRDISVVNYTDLYGGAPSPTPRGMVDESGTEFKTVKDLLEAARVRLRDLENDPYTASHHTGPKLIRELEDFMKILASESPDKTLNVPGLMDLYNEWVKPWVPSGPRATEKISVGVIDEIESRMTTEYTMDQVLKDIRDAADEEAKKSGTNPRKVAQAAETAMTDVLDKKQARVVNAAKEIAAVTEIPGTTEAVTPSTVAQTIHEQIDLLYGPEGLLKINEEQAGTGILKDGFRLYLQGVTLEKLIDDGEIKNVRKEYLKLLNKSPYNLGLKLEDIELEEGYTPAFDAFEGTLTTHLSNDALEAVLHSILCNLPLQEDRDIVRNSLASKNVGRQDVLDLIQRIFSTHYEDATKYEAAKLGICKNIVDEKALVVVNKSNPKRIIEIAQDAASTSSTSKASTIQSALTSALVSEPADPKFEKPVVDIAMSAVATESAIDVIERMQQQANESDQLMKSFQAMYDVAAEEERSGKSIEDMVDKMKPLQSYMGATPNPDQEAMIQQKTNASNPADYLVKMKSYVDTSVKPGLIITGGNMSGSGPKGSGPHDMLGELKKREIDSNVKGTDMLLNLEDYADVPASPSTTEDQLINISPDPNKSVVYSRAEDIIKGNEFTIDLDVLKFAKRNGTDPLFKDGFNSVLTRAKTLRPSLIKQLENLEMNISGLPPLVPTANQTKYKNYLRYLEKQFSAAGDDLTGAQNFIKQKFIKLIGSTPTAGTLEQDVVDGIISATSTPGIALKVTDIIEDAIEKEVSPSPSSPGTRGGYRLIGGNRGIAVRVKTPVNAATYDKIQSLVNSGAIPQYLIDNYGVFLAAPPQNPSEPKKLNLPYEPFRDDQLEVVIRLPSTRVDKESVLERFERKELLSRLKQNLASRLTNYKKYSTEYKDIKDLLHSMGTDSGWLRDMKLEKMGETKGIQLNPNQQTQHWKDAVNKITDFNDTLTGNAFADPADFTRLDDPNPNKEWLKFRKEGSEGHVSKAIVDAARWDDEISDRRSEVMTEYSFDFSKPPLNALVTPELRSNFLKSLGLDAKRAKSGQEFLKLGGGQLGGAGLVTFKLDIANIKNQVDKALQQQEIKMVDPQSGVPITIELQDQDVTKKWSDVFSKRDISENNMLKNDKRELAKMAKVNRMKDSVETLSVEMASDAKLELFKVILCSVPKSAREGTFNEMKSLNPDISNDLENFYKNDMKTQCSLYKLKQVGGSPKKQTGGSPKLRLRSATLQFLNGPENSNNLKGVIQAVKDGKIGSTAVASKVAALNPSDFDNDKINVVNNISNIIKAMESSEAPGNPPGSGSGGTSGGSRKRSQKKRKYMRNKKTKSRRN